MAYKSVNCYWRGQCLLYQKLTFLCSVSKSSTFCLFVCLFVCCCHVVVVLVCFKKITHASYWKNGPKIFVGYVFFVNYSKYYFDSMVRSITKQPLGLLHVLWHFEFLVQFIFKMNYFFRISDLMILS